MKSLLHKSETIFLILRGSEENAILFYHENIFKGIAIKLCSCGNPPASLEFCGEVSSLFSWNLVQISQLAIYFFWRQLQKRDAKLMFVGIH